MSAEGGIGRHNTYFSEPISQRKLPRKSSSPYNLIHLWYLIEFLELIFARVETGCDVDKGIFLIGRFMKPLHGCKYKCSSVVKVPSGFQSYEGVKHDEIGRCRDL
jgi:hypothetical protein